VTETRHNVHLTLPEMVVIKDLLTREQDLLTEIVDTFSGSEFDLAEQERSHRQEIRQRYLTVTEALRQL
jgi:hypothetical protein